MRVLLVEDSPHLVHTLSLALSRSGYEVESTDDGEKALQRAQSVDYDAMVLDLMLPGRDGLSVLQQLRQAGKGLQVMILTARDTVSDRVVGLQAGADDYMVKPFALEEFLARVEVLCRRSQVGRPGLLRLGDLVLDTVTRSVHRGEHRLELTTREYLLLDYFVRRPGIVVSRTDIEAHLYESEADPMSNVVDSAVCSLRKKLSAAAPGQLIHTRRGFGYVFATEQDYHRRA